VGLAINNIEREGKHVTEVRYYILSKYTSGARFAEAVREHWSIENRLHWQLDVSYGEDDSRLWRDHAPVNFSLLRRTSLSLHGRDRLLAKLVVFVADDWLAKSFQLGDAGSNVLNCSSVPMRQKKIGCFCHLLVNQAVAISTGRDKQPRRGFLC